MMRSLGGERVMGKKLQTPFSSWLEVSVERERVCDLEREREGKRERERGIIYVGRFDNCVEGF